MKSSRYAAEQIAFARWQAESGTTVPEVCRKMGISEQLTIGGRRSLRGWVLLMSRLKINHKRVYRIYKEEGF